jgi:Cu/Ag efflux pump CusA
MGVIGGCTRELSQPILAISSSRTLRVSRTLKQAARPFPAFRRVPLLLRFGEDNSARRGKTLGEIRYKVSVLQGINVSIGQPISHRFDHMRSEKLASIGVEILGDELTTMS